MYNIHVTCFIIIIFYLYFRLSFLYKRSLLYSTRNNIRYPVVNQITFHYCIYKCIQTTFSLALKITKNVFQKVLISVYKRRIEN